MVKEESKHSNKYLLVLAVIALIGAIIISIKSAIIYHETKDIISILVLCFVIGVLFTIATVFTAILFVPHIKAEGIHKWTDLTESEQLELLCQWFKNLPYQKQHLHNKEGEIWQEFFTSEQEFNDYMARYRKIIRAHANMSDSNRWDSMTEALNVMCRLCHKPNEVIGMIFVIAVYAWYKKTMSCDD
jgi:hypothetical protein